MDSFTTSPSTSQQQPCCCFSKPIRTWCGAVSLIIGIIFIAVGGAFSGSVTTQAKRLLTTTLALSGSLDVPIVASRIAAGTFGGPAGSQPYGITTAAGTDSNDNDNGLANDYFVASITNIAAVLATPAGATPPAPTAVELGPFVYRTYSTIQQDCASCGVSGGVMTWYDRKVVRYDTANSAAAFANRAFGGPWDTTYVTVPNTNYRGLEALLASQTGGVISSFEALAVPLLGLQGVAQLTAPNALDQGLRLLSFPIVMGAMVSAARSNNPTTFLADFISSPISAVNVGLALQLGGATTMQATLPAALFTPTTAAALAVSPLTPAGWALSAAALSDCPALAAGKPGAGAACTNFTRALFAAGGYAATPAGQGQAQADTGAILSYYGAFLTVSSPPSALQTQMQNYAWNALEYLQSAFTGCATGLNGPCEIGSWSDAVWSQMSNNGVTGLLTAAGIMDAASAQALAAGASPTVAAQMGLGAAQSFYFSLAGTGAANLCIPPSALGLSPVLSLVDILPSGSVPGNAIPEFSCWNARANPLSFGSKVSAATLKAVFGTTADAAASPTTGVATSLRGGGKLTIAGTQVAGTEGITNTGYFLTGVGNIITAVQTEAATGVAGAFHVEVVVLGAFAALKAAPTSAPAIAAYAAAVAAADAAHGTTCSIALGNLLRLPLRCFELIDLANYVNHIAKDVVFDATFAKTGPRKFNAATGAFVPLSDPYYATLNLFNEAESLRAGPFLRCTLREYLEVGCHDNLGDYAFSLLSPGGVAGDPKYRMQPIAPASFEGAARDQAWVDYKATNQPNVRLTGSSDISQIDVITAYSVNNAQVTSIAAFKGPMGSAAATNPVTGSYSGTAYAPSLKVAAAGPDAQDYSAAPSSISVWVYQGLRACSLAFSSQVTDPVGAGVKLFRFMLNVGATGATEPSAAQWASAIPRMKTDVVATTPSCSANIAPISSGVSVFLAPPYFAGCATTGLNGAAVPGYTLSGAAATRNANDPITGTVTYVDVEPITGRAMNAHKRLGAHMRWGGSTPWFNLKTTYGLLYWIDQHNAVTLPTAKKFLDVLAQVKMVTSNGTGALVAIGVILALVGVASMFLGCRMPRAMPGGGDEQQQQQQQQAPQAFDGVSKDQPEVVSVNALNVTQGVVFRAAPTPVGAVGGAGASVV